MYKATQDQTQGPKRGDLLVQGLVSPALPVLQVFLINAPQETARKGRMTRPSRNEPSLGRNRLRFTQPILRPTQMSPSSDYSLSETVPAKTGQDVDPNQSDLYTI